MNNTQLTRGLQSVLRISLLGLAILFGQSQSVYAQWATNGNNINNTNSGNVGIGVTAPDLPLDIRRDAFIFNSDARALIGTYDQRAMAQGVGGGIQFGGKFDTSGTTAGFASISGIKENGNNNDFASALVFTTRSHPNPQTERMRISSTGNVGIGTKTPVGLLDVQLDSATANKLIGRFGNNSTSGGGALRVYANVTSNATLYPALELTDSSFWIGSLAADRTSGLRFRTGSNISSGEANLTDRLVISPTGNVGIGTGAPTAKLHVAGDGKVTGNLTVDGNIAAKFQDVAEWVPAATALPPGTVVTLNPNQSNLVEASSKAYDTSVAGVISAQAGISLGEQGENKLLVATTGRVRMKVDATTAPIMIGDLLVTSDKEGVAMKSVPVDIGGIQFHRPGTLIGKALEPLAKGQSEILVLLSLQ